MNGRHLLFPTIAGVTLKIKGTTRAPSATKSADVHDRLTRVQTSRLRPRPAAMPPQRTGSGRAVPLPCDCNDAAASPVVPQGGHDRSSRVARFTRGLNIAPVARPACRWSKKWTRLVRQSLAVPAPRWCNRAGSGQRTGLRNPIRALRNLGARRARVRSAQSGRTETRPALA